MENSEQIVTKTCDGFAVVTLNKPARRNALGTQSMAELLSALTRLADDPACRAIILSGSPPAFCAGSDLKELGGLSPAAMAAHEAETARIARRIGHLPIPVIAAVEGYALGGGFALATSCDVVVTGRGVKWNMPEVRNGWIPPWGLQTLVARAGPVKARLIVWGILPMDGAEAVRLGVADVLAEDGAALETAREIATSLAALPAAAVRSTKRFFESAACSDAERQDAEAARLFAQDCEGEAACATLARFTVPA